MSRFITRRQYELVNLWVSINIFCGIIAGVSQVSCEPDVVHILDMTKPWASRGHPASASAMSAPSSSRVTTTTTVIDNRPLTIQTFKLEPGLSLESLTAASNTRSVTSTEPALTPTKVKLEPGLLQTLPPVPEVTPLKVEIQDNYLDSGILFITNILLFWQNKDILTDIEGALIIADEENALNNMTLDYLINENGTCTCKLCGEVTASRTHCTVGKFGGWPYEKSELIFLGKNT